MVKMPLSMVGKVFITAVTNLLLLDELDFSKFVTPLPISLKDGPSS